MSLEDTVTTIKRNFEDQQQMLSKNSNIDKAKFENKIEMLHRKTSIESDMCHPVSWQESNSSSLANLKNDEIQANIEAYDKRLNKCLRIYNNTENHDTETDLSPVPRLDLNVIFQLFLIIIK